jgi:hypothetical protein
MNKLNPHTLFSIFEKGDEEVYKEHGEEEVLDNPFVLMNMVTRGLENYEFMRIIYQRNFKEQFEIVEHKVKNKYYNKLYGYLLRVDVESVEDVYVIGETYERAEARTALNTLLDYYQEKEEYEKCGRIAKYIEMLVLEEVNSFLK